MEDQDHLAVGGGPGDLAPVDQPRIRAAVREILAAIGEDPDREGLLRTPDRYAQALMWMTKGYEERLAGLVFRFSYKKEKYRAERLTMLFL